MDFITDRILGFLMIFIGVIFFLVEAKALPHNPKNPEKWDELHAKYYRQIKFAGRISLLLGLTFTIVGGPK